MKWHLCFTAMFTSSKTFFFFKKKKNSKHTYSMFLVVTDTQELRNCLKLKGRYVSLQESHVGHVTERDT